MEEVMGKTGAPVVTEHTLDYLEAEVVSSMTIGTHILFVGRLIDAASLSPGGVTDDWPPNES